MKAIVVIDMPTKCSNCQFVEEWFNEYGKKTYYCSLHKMDVPKNGDVCKKLRPLPKRKNEYIDINAMGLNSCLDEITEE